MKNLKIYLLLFAVGGSCYIRSQSEIENHRKYYYYKSRVHNDFTKVGILPGESIIFNERDPQTAYDRNNSTYNNFPFTNTPTQSQLDGPGKLHTGDGSTRLGIYLSALATEYRLLKNNGQDVTRVKHEIFCALNAINRIDYYAEDIIGNSPHPNNPHSTSGPALNGFFIRDDVPRNFVRNNYEHFNYYNFGLDQNTQITYPAENIPGPKPFRPSQTKGFTQSYTHPVADEHSCRTAFTDGGMAAVDPWDDIGIQGQNNPIGINIPGFTYTFPIPGFPTFSIPTINYTLVPGYSGGILHGMEESQDQVFYILMACAFVKEMIDPGETDNNAIFGYGAGGSDLRQQAIAIADRVISHISADQHYAIRNPANSNHIVQTGGQAAICSYALDNAGCFIKYFGDNGDYSSNDMINFSTVFPMTAFNIPKTACIDYRNGLSSVAGVAWSNFANLTNFLTNTSNGVNNSDIFQVLSSVCNCIYDEAILKNLNIEAQMDVINQQISDFWYNPFYVAQLLALQAVLLPQLYSVGIVNVTDLRLANISTNATTQYDQTCSSGSTTRTGSDFIFPVFVRDILHVNNANPGLSSNQQIQGYNNTPGHLQLNSQLLTILNDAPCQGNYYLYPNYPSSNWGVSNRCDLQNGLWNITCAGESAEFSGTDYMLMHNLYYLREGYTVGSIDYSFRNVTANMPIGADFTTTNKRALGAFENIVATNIVNSNAAADYRAGKEIALLPGFSAVNNCDFGAFINPFNGTCGSPDMYRSSAGGNSSEHDLFNGPTNYAGRVNENIYSTENKQDAFNSEDIISKLTSQMTSFRESLDKITPELTNKIGIYPNPNSGDFKIEFNGSDTDDLQLSIYDVLGEEIYSYEHLTGYMLFPVSLKNLSKGVYTAKLSTATNLVLSRKIVIQ